MRRVVRLQSSLRMVGAGGYSAPLVKRTSWWLFGLLLVVSGCREHVLADGAYALTATQTLRDDCGLAGTDLLGDGTLRTEGHVAYLTLAKPGLTLMGSYRYGVEEMVLDGTLMNHPASLGGRECLLDVVSYHLETETAGPSAFTGAMSIHFQARQADACSCQYWFKLDGQQR